MARNEDDIVKEFEQFAATTPPPDLGEEEAAPSPFDTAEEPGLSPFDEMEAEGEDTDAIFAAFEGDEDIGAVFEDVLGDTTGDPVVDEQAELEQRVRENIPTVISVGFGDATIDFNIDPETARDVNSVLIGMGEGLSSVYRGVKQMLDIDVEEMKKEEEIMNELYSSDVYGTKARVGQVVGALAEPVGLVVPGAKMSKVATTMGKVAKGAAVGAGVGGAYGGLSYVREGESRLKNAAMGAAVGTVAGGAVGAVRGVTQSRKIKQANTVLDEAEYAIAKKVADDVDPIEAVNMLKKEIPGFTGAVNNATKISGRQISPAISKEMAQKTVKYYQGMPERIVRGEKSELARTADHYVGIMSTRLKQHSPKLFRALRKHDAEVSLRSHELLDRTDKFFTDYKKLFSGMPAKMMGRAGVKERDILDRALFNGDFDIAEKVMRKHGGEEMVKSFREVRGVLKDIGDDLVGANIIGKDDLIKDYIPRIIKDRKGLMNALGSKEKSRIDEALKVAQSRMRSKKARSLTPEEESIVINRTLRAPRPKPGQGKASFAQERKMATVPEHLLQFYARPEEAIHSYISRAVSNVKEAEFFGKGLGIDMSKVAKNKSTGGVDVEKSIGTVIQKLQDDGVELTAGQVDEITELLHARFSLGKQSPGKWTQRAKNIAYSVLLGNPISAATQLGDIGVSMYVNGVRNTLMSAADTMLAAGGTGLEKAGAKTIGKALKKRVAVTAKDMGFVDHMAEEFATTDGTSKFLNSMMKVSGFQATDRLGKSTHMNAAFRKATNMLTARNPKKLMKGREAFRKKYGEMWGEEIDELMADLSQKKVTERVKQFLFSELADVQPVSKSEVPQAYLEMKNGRIMYMLKSFMLKQLDLLRNTAFNDITSGRKAKGLKDLAMYSLMVGGMNAGADNVKDFIKGKDVEDIFNDAEWSDIPENTLKTFGMTQYALEKLKAGNPYQAVSSSLAPPFALFDQMIPGRYEDGEWTFRDGEIEKWLGNMPPAGKVWYYWFGGGLEKQLEREARER